MAKKIRLENLDALIFDFDGVLTDNRVYVDQHGGELVTCNRADGIAFDVLKKLCKPTYILSTERNPVVSKRGQKLEIPVLQCVKNKSDALISLANEKGYNLDKILYTGNDLNDFHAIKMCGYSACPADSHFKIKKIADITLKSLGGAGVVRELLEDILSLDILEILFPE